MPVTMKRLDHVNVRTANLSAMTAWYGDMLGMQTGKRPDFDFPGAWLYADGRAIIHLVGVSAAPAPGENLALEHFAISATGPKDLLARAEAGGERVMLRKVPGFDIVQVNLWDPDGNHIHIDFDAKEAEGLDL